MEFDRDLQSIQEVRNLITNAKKAQEAYASFTQAQVDHIVEEIAKAGAAHAEELAKMAVDETGFGVWQDKILKNLLGSTMTYDSIKDMKTVGIIRDDPALRKHARRFAVGQHDLDRLAGSIQENTALGPAG